MFEEIRCPICGAPLFAKDIHGNVAKCSYCKKESFLKSAEIASESSISHSIELRNKLDFEKAKAQLENVFDKYKSEPEYYWQLLLCDYGISYVDEFNNACEIPSLNRLQKNSIFENRYYKKLEEFAGDNLIGYQKIAEEIEKIRSEAYKVIDNEKPFDVFICYKRTPTDKYGNNVQGETPDAKKAQELYRKFKKWGLNVFFAEETLHKEHTGEIFEPYIYAALMTAKVFILIGGNSSHPEYVLSSWVKNEWQRYLKRMETESGLNFTVCLIDETFEPTDLPVEISARKIQCIHFAEKDFEQSLKNVINKFVTNSKIDSVSLNRNVGTINSVSSDIVFDLEEELSNVDLDSSEKQNLVFALQDMKNNSAKYYDIARNKLIEILKTNDRNFEANFNLILCYYHINDRLLLKDKDLSTFENDLKKVEAINDLMNKCLALVEEDQFDNIMSSFQAVLKNTFDSGKIDLIANFLGKDFDIFRTIFKYIKTSEERMSFVDNLKDSFIGCLKSDKNIIKKANNVVVIAENLFKDAYAFIGDSLSLEKIYLLYDTIGSILLKNGLFLTAKELFEKSLEINPSNYYAVWQLFFCLNEIKEARLEYGIFKKLETFKEFDLNVENDSDLRNFKNMYAVLIHLFKYGYQMEMEKDNYFFQVVIAINYLQIQVKGQRPFDMLMSIIKIYYSNANSPDYKKRCEIAAKILNIFGDVYTIQEDYDKARWCYNQIVNRNNLDWDAHMGLMKCDLKVKTNYGFLFTKNRINEHPEYKKAFIACQEVKDDAANSILEFYNCLEKIKGMSGKKKKKYFNAFKYLESRNINENEEDSITQIVEYFKNGYFLTCLNDSNSDQYSDQQSRKVIPLILAFICSLLPFLTFLLTPMVSILPMIVLLTVLICLFSAKTSRNNFNNTYTKKQSWFTYLLAIAFIILAFVYRNIYVTSFFYNREFINNVDNFALKASCTASIGLFLVEMLVLMFMDLHKGESKIITLIGPNVTVSGGVLLIYIYDLVFDTLFTKFADNASALVIFNIIAIVVGIGFIYLYNFIFKLISRKLSK